MIFSKAQAEKLMLCYANAEGLSSGAVKGAAHFRNPAHMTRIKGRGHITGLK